jgi:glycosyltransferase involved in cell wall biosynthesis
MGEGGLKVAILGINYEPEMIGIAPYATGLATALAERGHDVTVMTGYPHYPTWRHRPESVRFRSEELLHGVRVRRFSHPVPSRFSWIGRALMELAFGLQVCTARWGRPDVIVCITPPLLGAAMAVLRARLSRHRPAVGVIVQDLYSRGIAETGVTSGITAATLRAVESSTLRLADGISVIHSGFRADIAENLHVETDRIRVIRNWTHILEPNVAASKAFRAAHGWSGEDVIVLHAGNLGYKQGLENVIEAAALAQRRDERVKFVLIGDGNQRSILERDAAGLTTLQFMESVSEDEFPAALGAADLLLVNERPGIAQMSVPSKLTSYFQAGKPVIAAVEPVGYTAGEVAAAGGGVCIPPGRPDLLLSEALRLAADRRLSAEFGERGRRYSNEILQHRRSIDSYEQWIRSLVNFRQRRGERAE